MLKIVKNIREVKPLDIIVINGVIYLVIESFNEGKIRLVNLSTGKLVSSRSKSHEDFENGDFNIVGRLVDEPEEKLESFKFRVGDKVKFRSVEGVLRRLNKSEFVIKTTTGDLSYEIKYIDQLEII